MVDVRRVAPSDADAWLQMRLALWPEGRPDEHREEIQRFFAGQLRMPLEVLVAVGPDDRILGFAELSLRAYAEDCDTDRVAFLEGWYVIPRGTPAGSRRRARAGSGALARSQGCSEFASRLNFQSVATSANHSSVRAHTTFTSSSGALTSGGSIFCFAIICARIPTSLRPTTNSRSGSRPNGERPARTTPTRSPHSYPECSRALVLLASRGSPAAARRRAARALVRWGAACWAGPRAPPSGALSPLQRFRRCSRRRHDRPP